jgi:hypothetical protein
MVAYYWHVPDGFKGKFKVETEEPDLGSLEWKMEEEIWHSIEWALLSRDASMARTGRGMTPARRSPGRSGPILRLEPTRTTKLLLVGLVVLLTALIVPRVVKHFR